MKTHPFTLMVHKENYIATIKLNNACVDLCASEEEEEERGSYPLIRTLDLHTVVAAQIPADLLEPSLESSQEEHTHSSSSHQSPPEVHAQRGEGEVHLLTQ